MESAGIERRACIRFLIPGSTLSYKIEGLLPSGAKHLEEFCPLLDISRGGLRFLSKNRVRLMTKMEIDISIPGERIPLNLSGIVKWATIQPNVNERYQIGIQFNSYGTKKTQNYPGILVKIISLEQKYASHEKSTLPDKYEVEG